MKHDSVARGASIAVAVMLGLGVVGGLLWWALADPAEWEVTEGGIVLSQYASRGQFQVIVVFVLIGAVSSLLWGWATATLLRGLAWMLVPLVAVGAIGAALIAWQLGLALGPPSPASVAGAEIGDRLPSQLEIDAVTPFLVWPIFGLLGVLGASWVSPAPERGDTSD